MLKVLPVVIQGGLDTLSGWLNGLKSLTAHTWAVTCLVEAHSAQDVNVLTQAQVAARVDTLTKSLTLGANAHNTISASMPQTGPVWLATVKSNRCGNN